MKLFYRQFGSGKPLIILHGLLGLSDNWVSIGKMLALNYNVIIPDLRNHGQSPHSSNFSYDVMAEDIVELLDELGMPSAVIMGHSMGGKVALQFALQYPEKTDKLIIVDISMRQYDERHYQIAIIEAMMAVDSQKAASRTEISELLKLSIKDEKFRLFIMKNLYRKTHTELGWRPNLKNIFQNIDRIFEGIAGNGVYNGPSLFVQGAESDYVLQSDITLILQNFPQAVFKVVPDSGHWVHADNPEGFLNAIYGFLDIKPD